MLLVDFHELIDGLSKAKTVEELHAACSKLCVQQGFDHFVYGAIFPASFIKPYYVFVSGYPDEWWSRYKSENYMAIDPVLAHAEARITPIRWDQLQPKDHERERALRFMGEAAEFGLRSGISYPIHTNRGDVSILSFASEDDYQHSRADFQNAMPFAQNFSAHLHEAVRRIFEQQVLNLAHVHLTEREQQCLLWAAEGKTTWETSVILNVSERTVRFHLHNSSAKLGVVSRQHAVARAVSLGLINRHVG